MEKLVEWSGGCEEDTKKLERSQGQRGMARQNRKRKGKPMEGISPVMIDADPVFIQLNQWLRSRGQTKASCRTTLRPAVFGSTGRGLLATAPVTVGEVLVSIPRSALVTCDVVLHNIELRHALQHSHLTLKAMELLSLFLLYHKYLDQSSEWKPYLQSLPTAYTVPAYCSSKEVDLLPDFLQSLAYKQKENVNECLVNVRIVVANGNSNLQHLFSSLCLEDVRWAWFTVNTRSVYLKNDNPSPLVDEDVCALAPYLDLLNHTHTAQVTTGINPDNNCYEIVTQVPYDRCTQVFINYGPHDNIKLCVEYGFVLPDNPYNYVPVNLDEVLSAVFLVRGGDPMRQTAIPEKTKLIYSHDIDINLGISRDGPSWNLEVAATICLMTPDQLCQQDWNTVYSNPQIQSHRGLVLECLTHLLLYKAAHLRTCLGTLVELGECSDACVVTGQLVKECCDILEGVEVC